MKKKQEDKFFDEYMQSRKNNCFYNELNSESLLITKIWDFNKTILEKWADVNLLIAINEVKAKKNMELPSEQIAVVGDQIFTDVIGANRAKMFSILVKPINEKDIWVTKIKRPIENRIIQKYLKQEEQRRN